LAGVFGSFGPALPSEGPGKTSKKHGEENIADKFEIYLVNN
jgi:hypothetical protein